MTSNQYNLTNNFRYLCSSALLVALVMLQPAAAVDFVVNSKLDVIDANPGDGVCVTADSECTLRAAVMEANALPGADTIDLTAINDPADPIVLNIDGVDEGWLPVAEGPAPCVADITASAEIGDLDITEDLTIFGAGPALTLIRWDEQSIVDPDVGDRIFHIQAEGATTVNLVTLSDLAVQGGSVGILNDLDPENPYNCEVIDTGSGMNAWQFRRFGGGIAIGPGAAVVLFEEAIHGPDAPGGGLGPLPGGPDGEEEEGGVTAVAFERIAVLNNQSGSDGGGIMVTAEMNLTDSVISGNSSGGNGGALYLDSASVITGTTLGTSGSDVPFESGALSAGLLATPNSAENGGAIFDTGFHQTLIEASAINGNEAIGGGGIAARANVVIELINTTVSGNVGFDVGGGITTNGAVTLQNVTIADNTATTDAPGGGAGLNSFGSGTYTLVNTVLANNAVSGGDSARDANCGCSGGEETCPPGAIVSTGYNIEDVDTCLLNPVLNDQLDTDPLLSPLANNGGLTETHALPSTAVGNLQTSPAIDAGDNTRCPNNDQRGSIRPDDGDGNLTYVCDVGAFELFVPRSDLHINNVVAPNRVDKAAAFDVVVEVHNDDGVSTATNTILTVAYDDTAFQADAAAVTVGNCGIAAGTVTCGLGDMLIGAVESATLTFTPLATGAYEVTSAIASDIVDTVPENNEVISKVTVIGESDIELSGGALFQFVNQGEPIRLDYTVTNNGADDATAVRLGLNLSPRVTFASAIPDGSCNPAGDEVACSLGDLASGSSADLTIVVTTEELGEITLTAIAGAEQSDPDPDNNEVTSFVTSTMFISGGSGGGGCAYAAGGDFDPTLPGVLFASLLALALRRRVYNPGGRQ